MQTIPLVVFNFPGKTIPIPRTDIIMVALFCFSFVFFVITKQIIFVFFFPFFKQNYKTKV